MSNVKFIYFEGCPEAKNIRAALLKAGIYDFQVIVQNNLPANDKYRKYSSPSVLLEEELVYGVHTKGDISSCTFDYLNGADESKLVDRFRELKNFTEPSKKNISSFVGSFISIILAVKCPACVPAIGALLASLGLSFLISQLILKSLLILMLLLSITGLYYSYIKHRNRLPIICGLAFSGLMYVGRFQYIDAELNQMLVYISIFGLVLTFIWDYRLKAKKLCPSCLPVS